MCDTKMCDCVNPAMESLPKSFNLLVVGRPGKYGPPEKKFHLESGLNQRDRAKSAAPPHKSFVKTTKILRFLGCRKAAVLSAFCGVACVFGVSAKNQLTAARNKPSSPLVILQSN